MSDLPAGEMIIRSHRGPYPVRFTGLFEGLENGLGEREHLIVDGKVAALYSGILGKALASPSTLQIAATEENKSLEKMPAYVGHLIRHGVRRGDVLVGAGGGIIQDIVSFLAAVLFRGVAWRFYPTTLLAQADSCIGSKSSINVAGYKNQVGTFTPPTEIRIATGVLKTLEPSDIRSGIGEMIKVHLIAGREDLKKIARSYPCLPEDRGLLAETIRHSLEIKKKFVESDEFDRKERLLLNYGHTFGHAIETATQYKIPHGIAVTMGLDMAHFFSRRLGYITDAAYDDVRPLLRQNYRGFEKTPIPPEIFLQAISRDKKNAEGSVALILTKGPGQVFRESVPNDERFRSLCAAFLDTL